MKSSKMILVAVAALMLGAFALVGCEKAADAGTEPEVTTDGTGTDGTTTATTDDHATEPADEHAGETKEATEGDTAAAPESGDTTGEAEGDAGHTEGDGH